MGNTVTKRPQKAMAQVREKSTSLSGTLEGRWTSPAPGSHSGTQAGGLALPSSACAFQIVIPYVQPVRRKEGAQLGVSTISFIFQ